MNPDNTLPPSETADSSVPPSEPQKPLVTIATVTYNAAETLERTLSSVASQDYPRIEHLIIDGCSTDSTLSVVQQYVAENTRTSHPHHIRLISEPDNGLYDAMNKALSNASYEVKTAHVQSFCNGAFGTIESLKLLVVHQTYKSNRKWDRTAIEEHGRKMYDWLQKALANKPVDAPISEDDWHEDHSIEVD